MLLPEEKNFLPPNRRLAGNVVVVRPGEDLQLFRSTVAFGQPDAGCRADDFVFAGHDKFHRPVVDLQTFLLVETVEQQKIRGQKPHLPLCHRREIVVRHKQGHARNFVRMIFGEFTGRARADGFAHDIFWQPGW